LAVCAQVDYLITNDKHYNILKIISFPTVALLKLQEFGDLLRTQNK
jgi:hypothetical protein